MIWQKQHRGQQSNSQLKTNTLQLEYSFCPVSAGTYRYQVMPTDTHIPIIHTRLVTSALEI